MDLEKKYKIIELIKELKMYACVMCDHSHPCSECPIYKIKSQLLELIEGEHINE